MKQGYNFKKVKKVKREASANFINTWLWPGVLRAWRKEAV
jgi:hypothetical protein